MPASFRTDVLGTDAASPLWAEALATAPRDEIANRGADGVVHAICLNCMLGTAAAALLGRLRRDYGVPTVSLVYGSGESPALRTRLEAFVHQAHEHHRAGRESRASSARTPAAAARRWLFGR